MVVVAIMAHWWQILRSFSMKPFHLKTTEVNVPRCPFFWAIRLDIGEPFPRNLANPKKKDRGESCCWGGRSSCPKTKNFYGKAKKNIEAQFWFIFFTLYNTRLGGFQFQSCLECFCLYLRNKHNNQQIDEHWVEWQMVLVIDLSNLPPRHLTTTNQLIAGPFHQRLGDWFSKVQSSGHSTKPIKLADVLTQPFQD